MSSPTEPISGDALSALVMRSAPPTPRADALAEDVVREMAADARRAAVNPSPRRVRMGVVAALVGALALGGGAVAATAALGWAPWAENPDGAFAYGLVDHSCVAPGEKESDR